MNNIIRKEAKISLADAVERAKLATDDGLLNQSFYNMLISQVSEEDVHPLTMALVENGLMVRTGSLITFDEIKDARERLYGPDTHEGTYKIKKDQRKAKEIAQRLRKSVRTAQDETEQPVEDVSELREILENAGISVSSDGIVSFYNYNIPGVFKDRLPQTLPLATAVQLWEQKLEISDGEKDRVGNIQDALSRLKSQIDERIKTNRSPKISEIEASLRELEEYGFDPRSKSEMTQNISGTVENIFENVMSSNWMGASPAIDEAHELLDEYVNNQVSGYEGDLFIWDALDKLSELQNSNPEAFEEATGNFGGLAARLLKAQTSGDKILVLNVNFTEFERTIEQYVNKLGIVDSPKNVANLFVNNETDWMEEFEWYLLENVSEVDVPYFSQININFSGDGNSGCFVDVYGEPINEDPSDPQSSEECLDAGEPEAIIEIMNKFIFNDMKENKELFNDI